MRINTNALATTKPLAVKVSAEEQLDKNALAQAKDAVVHDDAIIYSMREAIIWSAADAQPALDDEAIIWSAANAKKVG